MTFSSFFIKFISYVIFFLYIVIGITPGAEDANVGKSSAGTENGMIYGNGSMNPILGYAITKAAGGYIETAQMK